jgi:hypothetical protein
MAIPPHRGDLRGLLRLYLVDVLGPPAHGRADAVRRLVRQASAQALDEAMHPPDVPDFVVDVAPAPLRRGTVGTFAVLG